MEGGVKHTHPGAPPIESRDSKKIPLLSKLLLARLTTSLTFGYQFMLKGLYMQDQKYNIIRYNLSKTNKA